ncbi:Asp-tRNA(Asn)/Glu-tRNA(Gln) amidotransferase subunit GatA [Endomicrobium proavitum]|uniref:Glutamyl-tRNA(Gln) amidotransferase subunit A n=1 Tax=Endomicrobium proavitum TaxID=1408281 RepID=A0A0G3WJZ6_9BACT|nr:Asp-tRNA(Asn)/Glu-tRNA(Gln) amidotransferase subunit GatA [Endomicrobium proavitum]AKL98202.1 Glutamyl-tRNA(Gln) amidotransferase subunit A [Endomicrobium proavitum]
MDDILKTSVKELRIKLCSGEVTSTDVVKACYKQIKEAEPKIKAFLKTGEEFALKQAAISDDKTKSGAKCGILEGVPVGIKDNIMIQGESMSSASKYLQNYISPYDATVIEKLKKSGAVLVGRLNMDEFAMGGSTETSAYQKTANPWDITRIPGGSSGGSAAAVASGMVPFALGSDTGGSIRQPAGFCGVVGYKPSYGLISRYGVCALASSFDQIGAFAKNVYDAALLTSVIAGKDYRDPVCEPTENTDYTRGLNDSDIFKGKKIGIPKQLAEYKTDEVISKAFKEAVERVKLEGAEIVEIDVPAYKYVPALYKVIMCAEVSANIATFDGIRYGYRSPNGTSLNDEYSKSRAESLGYEVKKRILFGTYVLGAKNYHRCYHQAQKVRTLLINQLTDAYKKCDVIFTPATLQMPVKFGQELPEECDIFLIAANLGGLPGITVPCAFTQTGLPMGVHFMGPRLCDAQLFKFAAAWEKISGFDLNKYPQIK